MKTRTVKKKLSLIMAFCMCAALAPVSALTGAASAKEPTVEVVYNDDGSVTTVKTTVETDTDTVKNPEGGKTEEKKTVTTEAYETLPASDGENGDAQGSDSAAVARGNTVTTDIEKTTYDSDGNVTKTEKSHEVESDKITYASCENGEPLTNDTPDGDAVFTFSEQKTEGSTEIEENIEFDEAGNAANVKITTGEYKSEKTAATYLYDYDVTGTPVPVEEGPGTVYERDDEGGIIGWTKTTTEADGSTVTVVIETAERHFNDEGEFDGWHIHRTVTVSTTVTQSGGTSGSSRPAEEMNMSVKATVENLDEGAVARREYDYAADDNSVNVSAVFRDVLQADQNDAVEDCADNGDGSYTKVETVNGNSVTKTVTVTSDGYTVTTITADADGNVKNTETLEKIYTLDETGWTIKKTVSASGSDNSADEENPQDGQNTIISEEETRRELITVIELPELTVPEDAEPVYSGEYMTGYVSKDARGNRVVTDVEPLYEREGDIDPNSSVYYGENAAVRDENGYMIGFLVKSVTYDSEGREIHRESQSLIGRRIYRVIDVTPRYEESPAGTSQEGDTVTEITSTVWPDSSEGGDAIATDGFIELTVGAVNGTVTDTVRNTNSYTPDMSKKKKSYITIGGVTYDDAADPYTDLIYQAYSRTAPATSLGNGDDAYVVTFALQSAVANAIEDPPGSNRYDVRCPIIFEINGKTEANPDGNVYYGYCTVPEVPDKKDPLFELTNVEDHVGAGEYYEDEEHARRVAAVVANGYWGTDESLEHFKEVLEYGGIDTTYVSDGVAMTATQFAIWYNTANPGNLDINAYAYRKNRVAAVPSDIALLGQTENVAAANEAFEYLISDAFMENEIVRNNSGSSTTDLLRKSDVTGITALVNYSGTDKTYTADLTFDLKPDTADALSEAKSLTVKVGDTEYEAAVSGSKLIVKGVSVQEGANTVTLQISQTIKNGAYVLDDNTSSTKPQAMITFLCGEGNTHDLEMSFDLTVDGEAPTLAIPDTVTEKPETSETNRIFLNNIKEERIVTEEFAESREEISYSETGSVIDSGSHDTGADVIHGKGVLPVSRGSRIPSAVAPSSTVPTKTEPTAPSSDLPAGTEPGISDNPAQSPGMTDEEKAEIFAEDAPSAEAIPKTGDISLEAVWMVMSLAFIGAAAILLNKRREKIRRLTRGR